MPIYNTDLHLTLSFDGWESELPITITYDHTPAQKGKMEPSTGIPLDPDIPESAVVIEIRIQQRNEGTLGLLRIVSLLPFLTKDQIAAIEEDILSDLQEN